MPWESWGTGAQPVSVAGSHRIQWSDVQAWQWYVGTSTPRRGTNWLAWHKQTHTQTHKSHYTHTQWRSDWLTSLHDGCGFQQGNAISSKLQCIRYDQQLPHTNMLHTHTHTKYIKVTHITKVLALRRVQNHADLYIWPPTWNKMGDQECLAFGGLQASL